MLILSPFAFEYFHIWFVPRCKLSFFCLPLPLPLAQPFFLTFSIAFIMAATIYEPLRRTFIKKRLLFKLLLDIKNTQTIY